MVIDGPQLEQVITVEPKLDGVFTKYINNDGEIFNVADLNKEDMAEALTHYSYELSNQQLLLVDVQGVGWELTDPEIASITPSVGDGEDEELLFCIGNFRKDAFQKFFMKHKCSMLCIKAELSVVDVKLFF